MTVVVRDLDPAAIRREVAEIRARAGLPPGLPPGFPSPAPPGGRVRAGILSPCCYLGGADIWTGDLLRLTDHSRIHWAGAAIRDEGLITPEVRASWEAHCPTAIGPDAIRALAARCDVLVAWGVFQSWGFPAAMLAPLVGATPLLVVSHGSEGGCLVPAGGLLAGAAGAAVSPAALRGLPEGLRPGARVVLNQVSPDRVAPTRTRDQVRAGFHVPPGMKVAGWLGRFASEKRPRVFVDAVARLPAGWLGVAAGIGYGLEDAMRHAAEVAPGRVHFLGGRTDVGDVLAAFDCLCMPSVTEACSLTAAESWLAGVPLVSTAVGLLEDRPGLARPVPNHPTGADLAAAILADAADPAGTAARVARARGFAAAELSPGRFGRAWTDLICSAASPRPSPRPAVDPAARDHVLRCPDRGPEGGLVLLPEELSCCGSGEERTECRAGKGPRPGRVTLRDCLACAGGRG